MSLVTVAWALGALAFAFGLAAGWGWAFYFAERSARRIAESWAMQGLPRESEPATITETPDAEEKALAAAEETAIQRAARFIQRERPNVNAERARQEAEKLVAAGIGNVRGPD